MANAATAQVLPVKNLLSEIAAPSTAHVDRRRCIVHATLDQEDSGICVEAGGAEMEVISIDGRCGYEVSRTCLGSRWGDCCSGYGWCGRKENHCDVNYGCQSGFGTCG